MAKTLVRKHRRMKKTVRKTLGALFLISAIVVAAIPVEGLQAAGEDAGIVALAERPQDQYKVTVSRNASEKASEVVSGSTAPTMDTLIPEIKPGETIYTTGTNEDGSIYQFAYVTFGGDWAAVLLGYNKNNNLPNNTLTIPNTVNAYIQPTGNLGTGNGYVAASQSGDPLFYEALTEKTRYIEEQAKDEYGKPMFDEENQPVMTTREEKYLSGEILPCYATDNAWKGLSLEKFLYAKAGNTITSEEAETVDGMPQTYTGYAWTTEPTHQWIKDAAVKYIGNQYLDSIYHDDTHTYEWNIPAGGNYITKDKADNGIFAGAGNIGTLNIGENLVGVGNYAFYNCTGLSQASFGNGLQVIGNWAFAGSTRMTSVQVPDISNIGQIGDHAFYKCSSLTQITIPVSVKYIGDYAFAGCSFLSEVELCNFKNGPSGSVLAEIGWNAFEDCESLYSLILPENYEEKVDISMFMGCKSLRYITSRNKRFTLGEDDGIYSFDLFKTMLNKEPVNGTFYFEGLSDSALHEFTKENCFAFSYIDYNSDSQQFENKDKYELTVQENDTVGADNRTTYVVNSSNELIQSTVGAGVENLEIPNQIGPYHIYRIGQSIFENNCSLKLVTVPASVQAIASEAFKGCHNLENVIFKTDTVEIGAGAFKTQDFTGAKHKGTCSGVKTDTNNVPEKQLHFVGTISPESTPYQYAMSYDGRYNNGSQAESFIVYYSGWPTNLTVEYKYDKATGTGVSELTNFPSFSELKDYASPGKYAYMTPDYIKAAEGALDAYKTNPNSMTEDQKNFINSALNLEIPRGVQAMKDGLFKEKEDLDNAVEKKTVNVYGLDGIEENDFKGCESLTEFIVYGDPAFIEKNAFDGCENLKKVAVNGDTRSVGDNAFSNCPELTDVTLSGSINTFGIRPFAGCGKLTDVVFQGQDYFTCADSIIYGMTGGNRTKVIECLEGRTSKYIKASELAGVTELAEEAFAGAPVKEIDLSESLIDTVPSRAFADTPNLATVKLPPTCGEIQDFAFDGSSMDRLEASQYLTLLGLDPFTGLIKDNSDVTICSPQDSFLYKYAVKNGFDVDTVPQVDYYTVRFRDWNEELGKYVDVIEAEQRVKGGEDATPPTPAGKQGYEFDYWDPDYRAVSEDITCMAIYKPIDPNADKLTVTFKDYDETVLKVVKVEKGGSVLNDVPNDPKREGYLFIGWDRELTNIQESFETKAVYKSLSEEEVAVRFLGKDKKVILATTVKRGGYAPSVQAPAVSGYTFVEWIPDITVPVDKDTDFYAQYEKNSGSNKPGGGDGENPDNPGGDNKPTSKLYTLTVKNGSGSGSYAAGTQPIVVANDPAANQVFSNWTIDPADTKIASKTLSATVITMPEHDVTVTANYKAKPNTGGSDGNNGNVSGGDSNNNRPNNPNNGSGGGTTVVIDKNGLSNTGVVTATVNGSSDNFTIRISESSAAAEAALKALMAEYGDDLSNIKYFPMDISLYDAKGQKKITDTKGLSVRITLPLPDSLITYAGNNKVAGVVDDRLDKLTPKFTTISGVSCVTFTAEHFSPYLIYVDTENLTAGVVNDDTPKTGDGIHPKWFLSIGLACIAIVLFMKKEQRVTVKAH